MAGYPKGEAEVERNEYGLSRYTFSNDYGIWLVGRIDGYKRLVNEGMEPEKARDLFKRDLRLYVPESAVR